MTHISRRKFLLLSAGTIVGTGLSNINFEKTTYAKANSIHKFKYQPINIDNIPNPIVTANQSQLINYSFEYIKTSINKIKNTTLKNKATDLITNVHPTFMNMHSSSKEINKIYSKLVDKSLIDPSKINVNQLFPKLSNNLQKFISAPGSTYNSHHAYPGGLCTHTASNICIAEGLINTYKNIFGYEVDTDIILTALAVHDMGKAYVLQWNNDDSCFTEYTMAQTGSHHIFSLVEAMYRNMPAEIIIAQACAHNHPGNTNDEEQVVNWIKAASLIAQKNPIKEGYLNTTGTKLNSPHHQEWYIVHLGDHDWMLSGYACNTIIATLKNIAQEDYHFTTEELSSIKFNRFRNYIGSQYSFMFLHNLLVKKGIDILKQTINNLIIH